MSALAGERMAMAAAALLSRAAETLYAAGQVSQAADLAQQAGAVRAAVRIPRQQAAWAAYYKSGGAAPAPVRSADPDEHLCCTVADSAARQLCAVPPVPQTLSEVLPPDLRSSAKSTPGKRGGQR